MQVLSEIYLIERVNATSPFLLCEVTQSRVCCHTGETGREDNNKHALKVGLPFILIY